MGHKIKVVAIGAHPDDIELSCGGFLLILRNKYNAHIHQVVCTEGELSNGKTRAMEQILASKYLRSHLHQLRFTDGNLKHNQALVNSLETIIEKVQPNLILTHFPNDYHQDHIAVGLSSISASRNSLASVMFYPSYQISYLTEQNVFVDITDVMSKKIELIKIFASQKNKAYMKQQSIELHSLIAGENAKSRYGEVYISKIIRLQL